MESIGINIGYLLMQLLALGMLILVLGAIIFGLIFLIRHFRD